MGKLVELQGIKIFTKLNLTADHWEFYHIDGREEAAVYLNRDVESYLERYGPTDITQVLKPYKKWGATDSEGYNTLAWVLDQLGIDSDLYV